jgi:hypothetical protein
MEDGPAAPAGRTTEEIEMDFGSKLAENAKTYADKAAIIFNDTATTYAQLNERACRFGNALKSLGLEPKDRVAVILRNRAEFSEIIYGAMKAGIALVPVNWRLAPEEMSYVINNSDACAVVLSEEFLEKVEPIKEELKNVDSGRYIFLDGNRPADMLDYEEFLSGVSDAEPGRLSCSSGGRYVTTPASVPPYTSCRPAVLKFATIHCFVENGSGADDWSRFFMGELSYLSKTSFGRFFRRLYIVGTIEEKEALCFSISCNASSARNRSITTTVWPM